MQSAVQQPPAPPPPLPTQPMDSTDANFSSHSALSSAVISLVPYVSPSAVTSAQFVFTGGSPVGSGGPHPAGLDTALTAQRMSRKAAGTAVSDSSEAVVVEPQQQQQQQSADEAKPQQQSRRGRRGRAGQGRQPQHTSRRNKHGKQPNGSAGPSQAAQTTEATQTAPQPLPVPQPQQPQPQSQQQTTPGSRGRRRRLPQQPGSAIAAFTDGIPQPPPPAVSHRRSTLRSSQRSQAPHTPYNTTAYILAHPPPGARPASSPDRYGADIVDMPEIDQWKGYGSMEKGVSRLKQQGEEERSEQPDEASRREDTARAGRSRRRRRDELSDDRQSSGTTGSSRRAEEEQMEHDAATDSLPPVAQPSQRRGRNSGSSSGSRGRGKSRGRSSRGRSINTSGLREANLRSGDISPALSGMSGGGSPAHSVVNGDDIERWTRRQRLQRSKVQKRAEVEEAAMNGGAGEDAVMEDDQGQHGWMQRVT